MECIVYEVTKSWTWLSNFHFHFSFTGFNPVVGFLDHMVVLFLVFEGISHTVLHSGCVNLHSHWQCKEGSLSSTSSPACIVCRLFDDGRSDNACFYAPSVAESKPGCVYLAAGAWVLASEEEGGQRWWTCIFQWEAGSASHVVCPWTQREVSDSVWSKVVQYPPTQGDELRAGPQEYQISVPGICDNVAWYVKGTL